MTDKPRWWLVVAAALMAALLLYQSLGVTGAAVLVAGVVAAFAAYRWYRARQLAAGPAVRCLTCGEALPSTARGCPHCGSARWTIQ